MTRSKPRQLDARSYKNNAATTRDGSQPPGAALTAEDCEGGRQVMLDCPHGSTGAIVAGGTVPDAAIVRAVLSAHYFAKGCSSTRDLRQKYGVGVSELEG